MGKLSSSIFIGSNFAAQTSTVMSATYTTYATVTGNSNGGKVSIGWCAIVCNGNSGADRTFSARIQCDGVTVREWQEFFVALANNRRYSFGLKATYTPSAATHTWTLQLAASVGSAIILDDPYIEVAASR